MAAAPQPASVEATLRYLEPTGDGVVYFDSFRPADIEHGTLAPTPVHIRSARTTPAPTLEQEGFMLATHVYPEVNFDDREEVRQKFYPAVTALARAATGASYAVAYEHRVRNTALPKVPAEYTPAQTQQYSMDTLQQKWLSSFGYVHGDYIAAQAPAAAEAVLRTVHKSPALLRQRYMLVNAWHPIATPVYKEPLALCDARSIAKDDAVPTRVRGRNPNPTLSTYRPNVAHAWYYFPQMTPEETLFFKHFDSKTGNGVAHSAFVDPTSAPTAPARQSVEVRLLLVFGSPTSFWRSLPFLSRQ